MHSLASRFNAGVFMHSLMCCSCNAFPTLLWEVLFQQTYPFSQRPLAPWSADDRTDQSGPERILGANYSFSARRHEEGMAVSPVIFATF